MCPRVSILDKAIPAEVLRDALSNLSRPDLCTLQLVSSAFRDTVDKHLPKYPSILGSYRPPRTFRFHLIVTTEDIDTPAYGDEEGPYYGINREGFYDEDLFPQLNLTELWPGKTLQSADDAQPAPIIPKYLNIQDFTLIYGRQMSVEQLRRLDPVADQWAPYFQPRKCEHVFNDKGMRFTLKYAKQRKGQIELTAESLEYILSRLIFAHRISLHVVDLPMLPHGLLSLRGIRCSYVLQLIVEGECHQKLTPDQVMDYVLGCDWEDSYEFDALYGRKLYLTVNILENSDAGMAALADTIIQVSYPSAHSSVRSIIPCHHFSDSWQ